MNFKKLLLFLVAPLMLAFAGCEPTPQVQTFAECSVTDAEGNAVTTMAFGAEQESATFTVTATRSWTITTSLVSPADIDEWFAVAPKDFVNADNSSQSKEITVSVFANEGEARTATLSIDYGDDKPLNITISQSGKGQTALGEDLYYDNFDKEVAAKEGTSWPNMDAKYGNPTPESQSGVTYASNNITVRSNSASNSSYSDYPGSGSNNLFFGKVENYVTINGISLAALEGNALTLTFGSEKYTQDGDSTFKNEEFSVAISADGQKWTNLNYTFAANANLSGRWNLATAQFNLKEVPATVSLRFSASVASVYRLDDVKLTAGGGGAEIDLSQGTDAPGGSTGGDTPSTPDTPVAGEGTYASDSQFVQSVDNSTNAVYTLGTTAIGGQSVTGFKLGKSKQQGKFTSQAVGVSGSKYLNFYAVAWKGTTATLYYRVDGGAAKSVELTANAGATGNPPYTALAPAATDHYSVLLEGLTATSTIEFATNAEFALTTHSGTTPDIAPRVIVFGVKLTDQPIEGTTGGGTTEPDQPANPDTFAGSGEGTEASPYDVTRASDIINKGAATSTAVYTKGIISQIDEVSTSYGNATYYISVDGTTTNQLAVFRGKYLNNEKFTAEDQIKVGDNVVVLGVLELYNGSKAEITGSQIVSLNAGEGGGTVTPDPTPDPEPEPEPEPTPGDFATIASVLALGQNATVAAGTTIEGVVISNMALNNLTSKKGLYVQDATGALQFYLAANHEFAFGDKVQIDLGGAKVGAYNGAVQISGLALDKITKVSSDNTVEAKTVSIADFLANKYEGQYVAIEGVQVVDADLAKTWVMGGAHTSINMEDANGNKFVVFSSKYATYGAATVAQGSGTIKGISSINNGNIQIIFAQDSDYAGLTGARLGGGTVTPEPEEPSTPDTPVAGEWAGRDDFNTVNANSAYTDRQTTAGWVGAFCAVQAGGTGANPVLPDLLGSDPNTRAFCILANSTQVGTITSPVLTTGCGKLKFTYALSFTDKNGIDITVEIKQNGATVKSFEVVNTTCVKYDILTFEEEVNVAGDFQIVFTNNGPSKAASGNKDRVSIWDIMWTAAQ